MIDKLVKFSNTQTTICSPNLTSILFNKIKEKMSYCMKIHPRLSKAFKQFYVLATFSNPELDDIKDFMTYVLYEKEVFPNYIIESCPVFKDRSQFLMYLKARNNKTDIEKANKLKNIERLVKLADSAFNELNLLVGGENSSNLSPEPNPHTKQFSAFHVYVETLTWCANKICTSDYYQEAEKWLKFLIEKVDSETECGDWCTQLAWIYLTKEPNNIQKVINVLKLLQERKQWLSELQLYTISHFIQNKAIRSSDRDMLIRMSPLKMISFPSITIYIDKKNDMSVDDVVKLHYIQEEGYEDGMHCEGGIIRVTFMLFFWEHIYECYVPGTFISNYQTYSTVESFI
ncbi:fanconi-associated nuclease 1 homolog [Aethina tumida]|uniref:fanconi-associated nuclease 1 homolog n=1 Tax=Aethina tumida TaxID=116153 RepID=UPI002147A5B1|nr:fanconi-associated nuclease 1 homolog [Aethina tumida]